MPDNRQGVLAALKDDALIRTCDAGGWSVTNLGAILFAKHLDDFTALSRKGAIADGAITPLEEGAAKKLMRYVPWWAAQARPGEDAPA